MAAVENSAPSPGRTVRNYQELRGKMSAGAREAGDAEYRRLVEEISAHQLRKARELTQTRIAEELHMGQGDVLAGRWRRSGDWRGFPGRARGEDHAVF